MLILVKTQKKILKILNRVQILEKAPILSKFQNVTILVKISKGIRF